MGSLYHILVWFLGDDTALRLAGLPTFQKSPLQKKSLPLEE
jgi:hypothetical protein